MAFNLREHITDTIIASIEAGTPPWRQNWQTTNAGLMPLRVMGEPYRGINVLLLWLAGSKIENVAPNWMTYAQAKRLGGQVRKGEKSTMVCKFGSFEKRMEQSSETETLVYMRYYRVFNAAQIDGLPEQYYPTRMEPIDTGARPVGQFDRWFSAIPVPVEHHDGDAYFKPAEDRIYMPYVRLFDDADGYYHVRAHETAHWGQKKLKVNEDDRRRQLSKYAFNELSAEIAACMVCTHLGVKQDVDQSAAYVESWLKGLRNDRNMIFRAASDAQKITDLMIEHAEGKEDAA